MGAQKTSGIRRPVEFANIEPAPVGDLLRTHLLKEEAMLRLTLAELVAHPLTVSCTDALFYSGLRLASLGIATGVVLDGGAVEISLAESKRDEVSAMLFFESGRLLAERRRP
jgi:hypothetical protein